jgi:hypothetical protein
MKTEQHISANRQARREQLQARLGTSVKNYLDAGAQSVSPAIAQRLMQARRAALLAMNSRAAGDAVSVGGGALARTHGGADAAGSPAVWGAGFLIALALAIYGGMQWDQNRKAAEAAEADIEILASDVPMDAFFDKGFKSFMEKSQ